MKSPLGKLTRRLPLGDLVSIQQQVNGIEVLPVELAHVLALEGLPQHHRDPFDRLIIAQAITTHSAILTMDPTFRDYEVTLAP